jgi:nicotinamidase/pyrazinamidase
MTNPVKPSVGVLVIDAQNDFCENRGQKGSLYIEGSAEDMRRGSQFILDNRDKIRQIYASFDVHSQMQIFHAAWWIETATGKHPSPYTKITLEDIDNGVYVAVIEKEWSREYVRLLEEQKEFDNLIWPNHCLQGTWGSLMHQSVAYAISEWQYNYGSAISLETLNKGWQPGYEFFGIFRPQVQYQGDHYTWFNTAFAEKLNENDVLYVFGEAESHCVGLSIKQLLQVANKETESLSNHSLAVSLLGKIVLLTDCMSDVQGYEGVMQPVFKEACEKYGMRMQKHDEVDILEVKRG